MTPKTLLGSLLLGALSLASCGTTAAERAEPAEIDTSAPLVVVDRDGARHDLDAALASGRPVLLVFWQSWCASCLEEAPRLARDSRDLWRRVDFVGVVPGPDASVDEAALDQAIEKYDLPYPQVRDRDLSLTRRFAVDGTPTLILLGEGGQVLYRGHRPPKSWSTFID